MGPDSNLLRLRWGRRKARKGLTSYRWDPGRRECGKPASLAASRLQVRVSRWFISSAILRLAEGVAQDLQGAEGRTLRSSHPTAPGGQLPLSFVLASVGSGCRRPESFPSPGEGYGMLRLQALTEQTLETRGEDFWDPLQGTFQKSSCQTKAGR